MRKIHTSSEEPDVVAIWDLLIELVDRQREASGEIARRLRVSRAHVNAIRALAPHERVSMSVLADRCGCQNTNMTPIVADLESRGVLARHSERHDKRVRTVSLTPKGERLRQQVEEQMRTVPSPLSLAEESTLRQFDAALRKVLNAQ